MKHQYAKILALGLVTGVLIGSTIVYLDQRKESWPHPTTNSTEHSSVSFSSTPSRDVSSSLNTTSEYDRALQIGLKYLNSNDARGLLSHIADGRKTISIAEKFGIRDATILHFGDEPIQNYFAFLSDRDQEVWKWFGKEAEHEGLSRYFLLRPEETLGGIKKSTPWVKQQTYYKYLSSAVEQISSRDAAISWVLSIHADARPSRVFSVWDSLVEAFENKKVCHELLQFPRWQRTTLLKAYNKFVVKHSHQKEYLSSLMMISPDSRDAWECVREIISESDVSAMGEVVDFLTQLPRWRENRSVVSEGVGKWALGDFDAAMSWTKENASQARLAVDVYRELRKAAAILGDVEQLEAITRTLASDFHDTELPVDLLANQPTEKIIPLLEGTSAFDALDLIGKTTAISAEQINTILQDPNRSARVRALAFTQIHFNDKLVNPSAIANALTSLEDPDLQNEAAKLGMIKASQANLQTSIDLLTSLKLDPGSMQEVAGIAGALAWRDSGMQALDALPSDTADHDIYFAYYSGVIEGWDKNEILEANDWFLKQDIDAESFQVILPAYIDKMIEYDKTAALNWAGLISDELLRNDMLGLINSMEK